MHQRSRGTYPDFLELNALITESEAADFLGFSVRALQNWRIRGGGPRFVRISSRTVRYRRRDLIEWTEQHLVSSTSETV